MPSYGGAHGPDGSKKSGDQGQGSRDSRGGQTGGMGGGRSGGFGGGMGARGTLGQQQDRRNMANANSRGNIAPGVGMGNPRDSRSLNSRYNQNIIATRPATLGNISTAILGGIPTPTNLAKQIIGGAISGNYDPYSGPVGKTTGYSYDGPNRFATGGMSFGTPKALSPNQARAQALGPANPIQIPDWWRTPF